MNEKDKKVIPIKKLTKDNITQRKNAYELKVFNTDNNKLTHIEFHYNENDGKINNVWIALDEEAVLLLINNLCNCYNKQFTTRNEAIPITHIKAKKKNDKIS